jgi:hypothetical protein
MEKHLTIAEVAARYAQNYVDTRESQAQIEDLILRMIAEARKGNLTLRYPDNFLALENEKIRHKRDSRLATRYVIHVEEVNGWLEKIGAPHRLKDGGLHKR